MDLSFDICKGGRLNNKNIIAIRYNGKDIFSLIGYYNAYTVEVLPDGNKTVEFDPLYESNYYKKKKYYNMGDGSIFYEDISSYTYKEPGTYLIITSGEIFGSSNEGLNYNIIAVNSVRRDAISLNSFCNYSSLREFNPININTSNVTDMSWLFNNCESLISLDVSNFDTSNVINMSYMFTCEALVDLDVSNFDTSNVTDMHRMFDGCESLTTLSVNNFDTSKVENMRYMFSNCNQLTSLDLSNFNTHNVTNMNNMFALCKSLTILDLRNWDMSNITNVIYMFYKCDLLHTLYLNNCSNDTINKIITSSSFPTGKVNGKARTIYCKRTAQELETLLPKDWVFSYID